MNRGQTIFGLILLACLARAPEATAQAEKGWAFSAGVFDIARDEQPVEAGVEYRWRAYKLWRLRVKPAAGVSGTEDGSAWVYGSARFDIPLGSKWVLTPQVGLSLYEDGDGKDLGGPVEFRSGLEIAYRFGEGPRVGVLFYHLSNAGIYDDNPGANSLVLTLGFGR